MISTRRIIAAVGLAAGFTGLAAPLAGAAETGALTSAPLTALDTLAVSEIPDEHKDDVPRPSDQLSSVTGAAAPVTGLVPGQGH